MTPTVDVISDVICSWCYFGRRQPQLTVPSHQDSWMTVVKSDER
jgi:predicted DsbA family dithiol-disulfide isomerase